MIVIYQILWAFFGLFIVLAIRDAALWGRRLLASQERITTALETLAQKSDGTGPG